MFLVRSRNESMELKTVSSGLTTNISEHYNKADKSCGPSRKATSWTSTPDLTTLSGSVSSQIGKSKSK